MGSVPLKQVMLKHWYAMAAACRLNSVKKLFGRHRSTRCPTRANRRCRTTKLQQDVGAC
jgi:hypothetical protein